MSAYMIIKAQLTNPENFSEYTKVVPKLVERYGGEYKVIGSPMEPLEVHSYESDTRVLVMSKWPSVESAKKFWNSPEYTEAKKLREGCGEFEVILVEGV